MGHGMGDGMGGNGLDYFPVKKSVCGRIHTLLV